MFKIRTRLAIAIVIALSVSFGCSGIKKSEQKADEWKLIGSDAKEVKSYYSPESVKFTDRNIVQVKVKSVFSEAKQKPVDFEEFEYIIQVLEIDCSGKKGRPLRTEGFHRDGSSVMDDAPSVWTDIPPKSNSEKLYGIVCIQKL